MRVTLAKVLPNPFRHMERYPIKREKVDALKSSIGDTNFWENIVARESASDRDCIEIAYGHHRLVALKEMYGATKEFDFIVRDLSDTQMAKIMAHENMEEWGSQADVEQETVRAIVEGYAEGRIELPPVSKDTPKDRVRYAPSFAQRPSPPGGDRPYTSSQLCEFLGWKSWKVQAALAALEKIEEGLAKEADFKGLTTKQAAELTTELNKTKRVVEAAAKKAKDEGDDAAAEEIRKRGAKEIKKVAREVSKSVKAGTTSTRDIPVKAAAVRSQAKGPTEYPDINPAARSLAAKLVHLLEPKDDKERPSLGDKISSIIKYQKHLDEESKQALISALGVVIDYASEYRTDLGVN